MPGLRLCIAECEIPLSIAILSLSFSVRSLTGQGSLIGALVLAGAAVTISGFALLPELLRFALVCIGASCMLFSGYIYQIGELRMSSGLLSGSDQMSGTVLADSRIIAGGISVYPLAITSVGTRGSRTAPEQPMRVTVFDYRGTMVYWMDQVEASSFSMGTENTVSVSEREVSEPGSRIFSFRRHVITQVKTSLGSAKSGSAELAFRLLLADGEDSSFPLAMRIRDIGCSHLLALSGMHLMLITFIAGKAASLLFGRRASAFLSSLAVVLFVFIAGPRASLVRAAVMYLIFSCSLLIRNRSLSPLGCIAAAFTFQLILFPSDGERIGFRFSYAAVTGILLLAGQFSSAAALILPKRIAGYLGTSMAALLSVIPLIAEVGGVVTAAVIPATMVLTPVIFAFMSVALLLVFTGYGAGMLDLLFDVLSYGTLMFDRVFTSHEIPLLPVGAPMLLTALAVLTGLRYVCQISGNRRREREYGSRFQLRFTQTDRAASGISWTADEQAIRSEFPDIQRGQRADHR